MRAGWGKRMEAGWRVSGCAGRRALFASLLFESGNAPTSCYLRISRRGEIWCLRGGDTCTDLSRWNLKGRQVLPLIIETGKLAHSKVRSGSRGNDPFSAKWNYEHYKKKVQFEEHLFNWQDSFGIWFLSLRRNKKTNLKPSEMNIHVILNYHFIQFTKTLIWGPDWV